MNKNTDIIFLSDSSISNPIIHSQGLPLLEAESDVRDNVTFLSFEELNTINDWQELLKECEQRYPKIRFDQIIIRRTKYLSGGIQNIIKGIDALRRHTGKSNTIIHCRSLLPTIIGVLYKVFLNRKAAVIYDNRGVVIDEEIYKGKWNKNSLIVKILRKVEKFLLKKCDHVVVVSNYFRKYLIEANPEINLIEKITVINNKTKVGSDKDIWSAKKDDQIRIVYSGSAAPWQNIPGLVELFKIITDGSDIQPVILSHGGGTSAMGQPATGRVLPIPSRLKGFTPSVLP